MGKIESRKDDFENRRRHLQDLSDEALKAYFWELAEKTVNPLIELASKNTSPAIERSVLLRMGFSSLEAKTLVQKVIAHGLIGKGAGHVVYRYALINSLPIREAGLKLIDEQDWDLIKKSFEVQHED
ncbi:MAG: ornithine aminomutase subunit alpha [Bacilli bacterium]|nr:ornithine aminomutase subunit alpha [Bacilli bacterium]